MEEIKEYLHYYDNRDEMIEDYAVVEKIMICNDESTNFSDNYSSLTLFGKWYVFSGYDETNEAYVWFNEDTNTKIGSQSKSPMTGEPVYYYNGDTISFIALNFIINRKLNDRYYEPWVSMNVKEKYLDVDVPVIDYGGGGLRGPLLKDRPTSLGTERKRFFYDDNGVVAEGNGSIEPKS